MKRPMIEAIMDSRAFCWLDYTAGDKVLYEIWLRWQTRHTI